ncbi:ABC transporter permease [uncultured Draconibacterium sp.]|uniref:ABC transporter permease n=1 Tax=uncultured Draconibacterium sp. TaxID=1573823 RepID=UPI002AA7B646|nr:ABC transporter permease [uncultured Draconibacterium sp.]
MTKFQYIIKSFLHYFKANLLVAIGVAISTMVLTGSLVIGDSVRHSLTQATFYRLGETTHLVAVKERYFRQEMAAEMEAANPEMKATSVLLLEGMAVADGGQERANKVQVVGIDDDFEEITNTSFFAELQNNEIAISENLAERLQKGAGDNILVRIKKASLIPMNAPFVSAEETSVALRATIKKVVGKEELGRFSLKNSQTAPYNIFMSIERLNRLMEFEGKANQILVSTELETAVVSEVVNTCLTAADAGLTLKKLDDKQEVEISTERVFMEQKISDLLGSLPGADMILTYFVNAIDHNESSIPYSFVSSVNDPKLAQNEIILNRWAADDFNANLGDTIRLQYFEIGPLRQLVNKEAEFILKEIVPMDSPLADPSRVPHLPGLSDAGHCREWEAGVPINLDAIRDKDEKYWDDYKGTPKAFISTESALQLWSNRFGDYTAVRYPAESFSEDEYKKEFAAAISPADLGMIVEPIREQGVHAAQNGTDFSGLFIGLSFFILVASIVLTALLFRLNLESRSTQIGLLVALGFQQKHIRSFYLSEGFVVSLFGGIVGLVISFFFTTLVFRILNSLWFDIVRTNVLEIQLLPSTLVIGLIISLIVSLAAIAISLRRFQKQKAVELQKQIAVKESRLKTRLLHMVMWGSLVLSVVVFVMQLLAEQADASMFFISGGLMLLGLLLLFRKLLTKRETKKSREFQFRQLSAINLTRNISRSTTIVTLFALGTFIVISTGSYKMDLIAGANKKTSGTGGFLYFAETTMPILFDINNEDKKAEEGIYEDFKVVQFRKVDGDDASCLNLNRIAQPAILGVDAENLAGRFDFAAKMKGLDTDPWQSLENDLDDGTIPAIADQTVIQWGLGMKVGDVIMYQNELGDTLKLKLIAGTKPSVFQGYVIISNKHFLKNYPSSSGSNIFLVSGDAEKEAAIGDELQSVFRDYGWEMESAAKRLVEFYSVTNTYLSIFLALGALGLILGTIGLAVILARTILERRREIALMQAIGFTKSSVFKLLRNEYLLLLVSGVLLGFVTAVLATLPAFLSTNTDASFSTVAIVVALILVNGVVWIVGLSWFSLKRKVLVSGLQVE